MELFGLLGDDRMFVDVRVNLSMAMVYRAIPDWSRHDRPTPQSMIDQKKPHLSGDCRLRLVCVFELWHCFECVLGCAGKNELSIFYLELIDRYRDVVLAKPQEAARTDDGVGDSFVWGDDDILDLSNALVLVVVDSLPHNLPLRAPARSNFSELCRSNAELGRARHLTKRCTRCAQQDGD